jgi:hypothetical protein
MLKHLLMPLELIGDIACEAYSNDKNSKGVVLENILADIATQMFEAELDKGPHFDYLLHANSFEKIGYIIGVCKAIASEIDG